MPLNLYNVAVEQTSPTSTYSMTSTIYNNHLDARPCWYRKRLASHHKFWGADHISCEIKIAICLKKGCPKIQFISVFPIKCNFVVLIFSCFFWRIHMVITNLQTYQGTNRDAPTSTGDLSSYHFRQWLPHAAIGGRDYRGAEILEIEYLTTGEIDIDGNLN